MPNFHNCKGINDKAYDLCNPTDHVSCASVADIQLVMPAEYIVCMLPDIKTFGQEYKYINDPFLMPELKWQNSRGKCTDIR